MRLDLGQVLYHPDQPWPYVYFPVRGTVVSFLALTGGGGAVEAGVVGCEGVVGLPVLLGAGTTPHRGVCQVAGAAWQPRAADFRAEAGRAGPLHGALLRYAHAFLVQVAQGAGCNLAHPVEQRSARWLLLVHDRVDGDEFFLTQEFLAQMLGVRRASVGDVMGRLREAGAVVYARGQIAVRDRAALEAAACACYRTIRGHLTRACAPSPARRGRARGGPRAAGAQPLPVEYGPNPARYAGCSRGSGAGSQSSASTPAAR